MQCLFISITKTLKLATAIVKKWFKENFIDEDEVLYDAISSLLRDGIPQKWIIREILGYKSKDYDRGRKRFHEIMDQSSDKISVKTEH
ncbi:Ribonuclease III [Crocosphaera watsonii WH 0401]|uniref:Ribonuclease III n=1 Tax=Crocosphaera watsonii WH 0401 TaxID=555881 RepID=T2J210_CROWT|nr:Ribonuclease III [Crocosphaera watsonii WH 0401]